MRAIYGTGTLPIRKQTNKLTSITTTTTTTYVAIIQLNLSVLFQLWIFFQFHFKLNYIVNFQFFNFSVIVIINGIEF